MFTHLHTHSHYSLLDGLPKIEELIAAAKKHNMKALALTDHGVMYGAIEFYQKAKQAGIKPIIGVEAYLARNGRDKKRPKIDEKPYHITLLSKNNQGYKNLLKLTSIAHLEGFYYKPRIDIEVLEQYSSGIIALSGCIQGEIPQFIINNQLGKAEKVLLKYKEIFNNDFYLEIQDHPGLDKQKLVNKKLLKLAKKHNVSVVATADLHYIDIDDKPAQDILLCIQTKKKQKDKNRLCMLDDEYVFRSAQEMEKRFKRHPEAIENTQRIANQCNVEIELGKTKLPHFPVPNNKPSDEYLKELCEKRLSERYPKKTKQITDRLEYELSVIQKTGFASYFLIVEDFVNWAKQNGIVTGPGRGSVAGSIVSYILNITNIDPLQYELMFERFMVIGRVAPPDIDLDFADTRRDEVIEYVENKYGKDHVAQIITFGTMAARAAIRDVGRVLDYPYTLCDKLAKTIPFNTSLDKALSISDELKEMYYSNEDAKTIIDMAKNLEGVVRHASKHACGVVITPDKLTNYMPIQYDVADKQTIVSQYEMHAIEDLGLLKMDFLGLKNLTVIENAIKIIKGLHSKEIDIDEIPLDDKKTFALLKKAQTQSIFQLESQGMRRYLEQLKPTEFEDIITMISLYRPGPMELIPEYIGRRHGKKKITYIHPKLKPILENTYAIAVFQEQVLQIARDLAGFTLTEADVLRKAVGKKIPKLLKEQKQKFISGCVKNNIPKHTAEKIFAFIEPFAGYAFNKSHSTCYAMIAYQTAYLKANYPAEFMAAVLTSDQDDIERIAIEVEECRKMNIDVLPPDINESYKNFTVVEDSSGKNIKGTIRFGLLAIKNVGKGIVKSVIDEREENGAYQNLEDFLSRVTSKDLNKKSLESLVKSGAMDKLDERNQMLENMPILLEFARKKQKEKEQGQTSLFESSPDQNALNLNLKQSEPAKHQQKLLWEKELLGLFISSHPLQEYEKLIQKYAVPISKAKNDIHLQNHIHKNKLKIVGIITNIKKITTSNNQNMLFVNMSDPSGDIEAIVFPNVFKSNIKIWEENKIVSISGRLSDKDGVPKIIVESVKQVDKDILDEWLLKDK